MDGITGQTLKHDTSNWNTFVFIEKEKKVLVSQTTKPLDSKLGWNVHKVVCLLSYLSYKTIDSYNHSQKTHAWLIRSSTWMNAAWSFTSLRFNMDHKSKVDIIAWLLPFNTKHDFVYFFIFFVEVEFFSEPYCVCYSCLWSSWNQNDDYHCKI